MVPAWILDIFAALILLVAAVSAARLVAARRQRTGPATADVDVAHLLMGIAMAGTLTAALTTLPDTAWEIIFGLTTAWFAWRVWRDASANGVRALAAGHCAPHLVHSSAMLYMFLAAATPAGGSGMGGMGGAAGTAMATLEYPTLALAFALVLAGYAVWDLDQLSDRRYSLASAAVSLVPSGVPAMAAAESAAVAFSGPPPAGDLARIQASPAGGEIPGAASGSRYSPPAVLLSPGTTVGCRIVMGVTMAFMLAMMI
jgi:hypothetical protein